MDAPSKSWTDIIDAKIDADSPATEELKTFERDNAIHTDERIGIPVAPGNRQANHAHKGLGVDGSDFISLTPQENILAGGDNPHPGFTSAINSTTQDQLAFWATDRSKIIRAFAGTDRLAIFKSLVSANIIKKIKSASGKGRFTCSMHIKRVAAASGVVGGTLQFGLHNGTIFLAGANVDIDFDDVTQEYKRFYFISDQIVRPTSLRLRAEWTAHPSDWDTIVAGDTVAWNGGYMVNNGPGLAKWDISHHDGTGDDYDADANDVFYWWDEIITNVELSV